MLPELPVTEAMPALRAALSSASNAVLIAPPGAGKTTLVPLALMEEAWAAGGRILVLEPRRVAARAAARREMLSVPVRHDNGRPNVRGLVQMSTRSYFKTRRCLGFRG